MKICGIDEAGRGPFIGPMIISGFVIDDNKLNFLKKIGVKDSKLLTRTRREEIFEKLIRVGNYKIIKVNPIEIDKFSSIGVNLNELEMMRMADIVNELKPDVVYIDCPSTNVKSFIENFKKYLLDKNIKIIAEHKADFKYPIVGAASILSKVTRDNFVDELYKELGYFGSGYLTDEITISFLEKNFDRIKKHPQVRRSWETYHKLISKHEQKDLFLFFNN